MSDLPDSTECEIICWLQLKDVGGWVVRKYLLFPVLLHQLRQGTLAAAE